MSNNAIIIPAIPCPTLTIPNSDVTATNGGYGDVVTVMCNAGYHITPTQTTFDISCELVDPSRAEWSGIEQCSGLNCTPYIAPYLLNCADNLVSRRAGLLYLKSISSC